MSIRISLNAQYPTYYYFLGEKVRDSHYMPKVMPTQQKNNHFAALLLLLETSIINRGKVTLDAIG